MKLTKRVLSVLLAALICLSALGLSASARKAGELKKGDTFAYGLYPQTLVTDPDLLEILAGKTPDANGDVQIGTGMFRKYHYEVPDAYTQNKDAYEEYILAYLKKIYEQYEAYLNAYGFDADSFDYWFAYEPIQWRVLDVQEDGNVLLMAETVLDARAFTDKPDFNNPINWGNSSIRQWLNGTFMDTAFTAEEKAEILVTDLENKHNPVTGTKSGANTSDKVFLPSFDDITNSDYGFAECDKMTDGGYGEDGTYSEKYSFSAAYYEEDPARKAYSSDFAKSHGVWACREKGDPDYDVCRYWLRTSGYENGFAAGVLEDGRVSTGWLVNNWILGIRPMIRVTPDAVSAPLRIYASDGTVRYRQEGVRIFANQKGVLWESSNTDIAEIDEDGNILISDVGIVTITATLEDDPTITASCQLEIKYTWWQHLIRIFLFGWLWY